jgi:hypothetical protein
MDVDQRGGKRSRDQDPHPRFREAVTPKPQTSNPKTPNPKPQTLNPKPQTLNPRPSTRNPQPRGPLLLSNTVCVYLHIEYRNVNPEP